MKPYEENSDATDMAPITINTITLSPDRTGQEVDSQTTETIAAPIVATNTTNSGLDVIINGARIKNPG
jgi:hypothetical protein